MRNLSLLFPVPGVEVPFSGLEYSLVLLLELAGLTICFILSSEGFVN